MDVHLTGCSENNSFKTHGNHGNESVTETSSPHTCESWERVSVGDSFTPPFFQLTEKGWGTQ